MQPIGVGAVKRRHFAKDWTQNAAPSSWPIPSVPPMCFACEAPDLLQVPAARQPAHPDRSPSQLRHELRQTAVRPGSAVTLRDFEHVKHRLGGDALNAIVTDLPVQPFQRQAPWIAITGSEFGCGRGSISASYRPAIRRAK